MQMSCYKKVTTLFSATHWKIKAEVDNVCTNTIAIMYSHFNARKYGVLGEQIGGASNLDFRSQEGRIILCVVWSGYGNAEKFNEMTKGSEIEPLYGMPFIIRTLEITENKERSKENKNSYLPSLIAALWTAACTSPTK